MYRFFIFLLLIFSCSGSQQTQVEAKIEPPVFKVDTEALIKEVQTFRDLNFKSPPTIVAVQTLSPDIPLNIDSEYRLLNAIFPGPSGPSDASEFGAVYKKDLHRIEYLSQEKGEKKERAIFLALVMALDAQQEGDSFTDESLDHYLANQVRQRSAASFLLVLRDLKKSVPHLSADRIANRPGSWLTSKVLSADLLNKFTFRNAVIFGAAMYRSNKISGLEYGVLNGPVQSGAIKRPDRWLAGEGFGKWTLPQIKSPEGYQLLQEGQMGPLFLERAMGPEPALSFWQGGHYRAYEKEGSWGFEWVTMWETPTAASVAGEIFRDFFTILKSKGGGTLSVIEKGNVLAISGSLKGEPFWLERAKTLTASQLVFYPAEKPFLHFIPTSLDTLAALKSKRKNLSAPGAIFSEEILKDWKVERPKSGLWWYATLGKAAIIQCNVELRDLGALSFADEKYGKKWYSIFRSTVENVKAGKVQKIDWNGVPTWEIDMEGKRSKADDLRRIISRQYAYGEFLVSVSLVSDPRSTTAIQTFKNLVENTRLTRLKK